MATPEIPRIHQTHGMDAPAYKVAVVAYDDSADLPEDARFLYVAAAGAVRFTPAGNDTGSYVTWTVAAGTFVPVRVKRVYSTGTTVTAGQVFACR